MAYQVALGGKKIYFLDPDSEEVVYLKSTFSFQKTHSLANILSFDILSSHSFGLSANILSSTVWKLVFVLYFRRNDNFFKKSLTYSWLTSAILTKIYGLFIFVFNNYKHYFLSHLTIFCLTIMAACFLIFNQKNY